MLYALISLIIILSAALAVCFFYLLAIKRQYFTLRNKYKINPDYDCQVMMADMLSGDGLYKFERLDTKNLFYHRG